LSAKTTSHRKFGTALLTLPDGFKIDVATARTEYYEYPAALPTVEHSSIKMDLYRRDFTVNALAVCLNGDRYGELLDFFGGQRDLRDKTLRIIHNLSFVEDPTRILRAARFEVRFGLRLSRHAELLSVNAVRLGLLDKVAGSRLFTELQLILREARPWMILHRLDGLGALTAIHPRFGLGRTTEQRFQRVGEVLTWHSLLYLPAQPSSWLVFLLVLLEERPGVEARAILRRFDPPPKTATIVVRDLARLRSLARSLQRARDATPSRMHRWLVEASTEVVLALMAVVARPELRKAIGDFLTTAGRVRSFLAGDDLRALGIQPGPVYRDILNSLLYARLDGHVQSRDDELRFVRRRFARAFASSDSDRRPVTRRPKSPGTDDEHVASEKSATASPPTFGLRPVSD
jgi:tRNA nucleotidyltransferase (CCA-adding enzyme)